jgi:hypothetical protein
MRKAHFDLLAFVAGFCELRRCHLRTGVIASFLVQVACDLLLRWPLSRVGREVFNGISLF